MPRFPLAPVLAGALVSALPAQVPGLGEEKLAIDVQTKATNGLGGGPWQKFCGVARDASGNFWAVSGHPLTPTVPTPGKLVKLDGFGNYQAAYDQPTATKNSSFGLRDLAIDPSTSTLWGGFESNLSGNVIWSLDLTKTPLAWSNDTGATGSAFVAPPGFAVHRGLAYNRVTKTMWVCNYAANPLTEFDRAGNVLSTIPIARLGPGAAPYGLAVTPDGKRLWAYSQGGSTHTRIDPTKGYAATGFNVLIEIDIDPASARSGYPTGTMTLGSASGGAVGGVPPNPVYQTPIAGGLEVNEVSGRLELCALNQGASDHVSVIGCDPLYESTCGGRIGVTGDAPYAGNTAYQLTLRASPSAQALLVLGIAGAAATPAGPPLGQPGCKILVALSPAPILFPLQAVSGGAAVQSLPLPATLTPFLASFQWAEVDPTVGPALRLSDAARVVVGLP